MNSITYLVFLLLGKDKSMTKNDATLVIYKDRPHTKVGSELEIHNSSRTYVDEQEGIINF